MNLAAAEQTFIEESRGLIDDMDDALMLLEENPEHDSAIHAVFRAAHTIKGSAGLFGLSHIVAFTHSFESDLARIRSGEAVLQAGQAALWIECSDHIKLLIDLLESGTPPDETVLAQGRALGQQLDAMAGGHPSSAAIASACLPVLQETLIEPSLVDRHEEHTAQTEAWHLSLRPSPQLFEEGFDPLSFILHLRELGEVRRIHCVPDRLPPLAELNPEHCHLGFEVELVSQASKTEIETNFEFIASLCDIHIIPPHSKLQDYLDLIGSLPEDRIRLGEILVACGTLTPRELAQCLQLQAEGDTLQPLGQVLVAQQLVPPEVVQAGLRKQAESRQKHGGEGKAIRVHADKLDQLINLVGELVIAGAGVGQLTSGYRDRPLREAMGLMARLTEEVRDSAMRLRMVEIGETFHKFKRVVRDVSKEIGKDIELLITGAETELDKSVVEKIGDPLTHLVRNAMDHGIEPTEVRLASGKPARGRVELHAYHEAGNIVIEVRDDGGGLNRERILAKALEQGLIDSADGLSDQEVWHLIFLPGFSTAQTVSNLSGRGVGMDVVKQGIESLRGSIEIHSTQGQGSRFRIRLPLTLAIIDGFLMTVNQGHYVVPLSMVTECVRLDERLAEDDSCLDLRGEVLPLIRLRQIFELEGQQPRRQNVVVVRMGEQKAGLVVDALKGELQTVIKPLGRVLEGLPGLSGTTILGTGEVALVLDVPTLLGQAARQAALRMAPAKTQAANST